MSLRMIRLRLVGKLGQTRRGGVAPAPASSPTAQHGGSGAQGGNPPPPLGRPRDHLDDIDRAVAEAAYERWINR